MEIYSILSIFPKLSPKGLCEITHGVWNSVCLNHNRTNLALENYMPTNWTRSRWFCWFPLFFLFFSCKRDFIDKNHSYIHWLISTRKLGIHINWPLSKVTTRVTKIGRIKLCYYQYVPFLLKYLSRYFILQKLAILKKKNSKIRIYHVIQLK